MACPLLVVSDGARGLIAAIEQLLPTALRQRCLIHRLNVLAKIPAGMQAEIHDGYWGDERKPSPTSRTAAIYGAGFSRQELSGQCPDRCYAFLMSDRAVKPRRHRLEVRVTPEQDALIRQAADLEDTTVTAFVLDTVTSRARGVVKQHQDLVLSNRAFDRFIAELDKPATPVPELVELFKNNPELFEA